jgi:hypothetical protein
LGVDLGEIRRYLRRTEWGEFPNVLICASETAATRHPLYAEAKVGNPKAADGLVTDLLADDVQASIQALIGPRTPRLVAVHALDVEAQEVVPREA